MFVVREDIASFNFSLVYHTPFISLFVHEQKKLLLCQTLTPYISIDAFKNGFRHCSQVIEGQPVETFIFDKRSLRAFHQPSMEWYFVEWKQEMFYKHGLRRHRKILPVEPWFRKSVEAGRAEIALKHPDNIFDQLDIRYTKNIAETMQE